MQKMKQLQARRKDAFVMGVLVTGLLSAAFMTGCGSGGTIPGPLGVTPTPTPTATPVPTPTPTPTPSADVSRFVGTWSGPFTLNTGQAGLTQVEITETGSITGLTVSNEDGTEQGPANGSITGDGVVDITFQYGSFTITCRGTMTVTTVEGDEQLSGTLDRIVNGSRVGTVQVTLTRGGLRS
jgi:hypothetical protein